MADFKVYVENIQDKVDKFLEYVSTIGNECAYTDRMIEDIIKSSKELENEYYKN